MLHIKFYKPLIGLNLKILYKKNKNYIIINKQNIKYNYLNNITKNFIVYSTKICFYTNKYKTQTNILKQSRFTLRHTITFNKDHT